jgi:hypothetical protein
MLFNIGDVVQVQRGNAVSRARIQSVLPPTLSERKKNKRGFCSMGGAGGCVAGPFDVITQGYSATQGGEGRNKAADRRMQGSKLTPGDTRRRERRISNNRYVQNPSKIVEPGW